MGKSDRRNGEAHEQGDANQTAGLTCGNHTERRSISRERATKNFRESIFLIPTKEIVMRFIVLFAVLLTVSACATDNQRVEEGVMMIGIRQSAFLDVWGKPARTSVTSGQEVMRANVGNQYVQGSFFKGRETLEVWEYPDRKTVLIFSNKRLRDWKTDATTSELATPKATSK
jgi:hypothetical protein